MIDIRKLTILWVTSFYLYNYIESKNQCKTIQCTQFSFSHFTHYRTIHRDTTKAILLDRSRVPKILLPFMISTSMGNPETTSVLSDDIVVLGSWSCLCFHCMTFERPWKQKTSKCLNFIRILNIVIEKPSCFTRVLTQIHLRFFALYKIGRLMIVWLIDWWNGLIQWLI